MKIELVRVTYDPVNAIENAACNCYDSEPAGGKIMNHCFKSGHTSVLEFAHFHFHIEGVSRALLAQLTRHRMASYAVRSQRYCIEDGAKYITPPSIAKNPTAKQKYDEFMNQTFSVYDKLRQLGVPAEDARYVLTNACETSLDMEFNLRSLMNFMNERLCTRAQWEIRELAREMRKLILEVDERFAPMLVPKCEKQPNFHFCPESKGCGRHKTAIELAQVVNQCLDMLAQNSKRTLEFEILSQD